MRVAIAQDFLPYPRPDGPTASGALGSRPGARRAAWALPSGRARRSSLGQFHGTAQLSHPLRKALMNCSSAASELPLESARRSDSFLVRRSPSRGLVLGTDPRNDMAVTRAE